jgi:hypothetical protein
LPKAKDVREAIRFAAPINRKSLRLDPSYKAQFCLDEQNHNSGLVTFPMRAAPAQICFTGFGQLSFWG